MNIFRSSSKCAFALFLVMISAMISQPAVSNAFTEGKTVRLLVFATPGGGYDYYSRLVARHISKYLPEKSKGPGPEYAHRVYGCQHALDI